MTSASAQPRPEVTRYRVIRAGLGQGNRQVPVGTAFDGRTDLHDFLTIGRWALLEDIGEPQAITGQPCSPTG